MADQEKTNAQLLEEIEELRRQVADLRENESKYRSLFQDSPIGAVLVGTDAKFLKVNRAFCDFLGYSERELLNLSVPDITHPEDLDPSFKVISRAFDSGIRFQRLEKRYLRKNGQFRWGEVTSTLICNAGGKPSYVVAQVVDIDDRKRAEAALIDAKNELERLVELRTADLRKANEELEICRLFVQSATQGFGIVDLQGNIEYENPAMCRLAGEDYIEDRVGKQVAKNARTADNLPDDYMAQVLSEGRYEKEGMIFSRQGKMTPVWNSSFLIRDDAGKPAYVATILTDISERKEAEKTLRQSRDELQIIYEQITDAVLIVDAETIRPLQANRAFCRMIDWTEKELESFSPERIHPPEAMPRIYEHFEKIRRGLDAWIDDVPILRKDGGIVYADAVSRPIIFNERPAWISFFHDITGRKQSEEKLRREDLTLKCLLQSSDHERQLISYEIHDGLAQYLAAAIMQFEAYLHLLPEKPREAKKAFGKAMELIHQAHFEARRLIAGVRPPVLDEAGVIMAVNHLVNEQNRAREPHVEFVNKVKFGRLVPILENAIFRICQEGLSNVCKHSHSHRARISLIQHKNRLEIEIRDWGKGFAPKQVKNGCYGLLGIRERARMLGGVFRISSASGKGSRLRVELPLLKNEDSESHRDE
jgi:PAS domain S-box-containing protein